MRNQIRPRLDKDEYEEFKRLKSYAKQRDIPLDQISQVWYKGKHFSIQTKNKIVSYSSVRESLLNELKQYSPKYPTINRKGKKGNNLLVIDIADLHINKYANKELTGEEYDSNIAVKRAIDGTRGLLEKSSGFGIEKILFVIGNDVLNTDNIFRGTTKGTQQDTDVHWLTAFKLARTCYVKCIELCMQVADVDIVHCPSNHDLMSGCFLADSIYAWFRNSKNVNFDISASYRKYYKYGLNMLEFEHGDKGKMSNLPLLMAQEQPKMWAETKFRYGYLHHVHHQDKNQFKSSKDYIGVNITYLRSPSSADQWHSEQGYKSMVAVEAFIHNFSHGRVAHLTHYY